MSAESRVFRNAVADMIGRLGPSVVAELQPVIEVIAASLQEGRRLEGRDVSVRLQAPAGRSIVVSVRSGNPRMESIPAVRGLDQEQLLLVQRVIDERISETISVRLLSSLAGLSRSHFSLAFRRSFGKAPHEYIVNLRLERAMKHMRETDLPLSEIALAAGFCDQAHFANKFRRATGFTPTAWRRRHRTRTGAADHLQIPPAPRKTDVQSPDPLCPVPSVPTAPRARKTRSRQLLRAANSAKNSRPFVQDVTSFLVSC